jgi:hypothetical protein
MREENSMEVLTGVVTLMSVVAAGTWVFLVSLSLTHPWTVATITDQTWATISVADVQRCSIDGCLDLNDISIGAECDAIRIIFLLASMLLAVSISVSIVIRLATHSHPAVRRCVGRDGEQQTDRVQRNAWICCLWSTMAAACVGLVTLGVWRSGSCSSSWTAHVSSAVLDLHIGDGWWVGGITHGSVLIAVVGALVVRTSAASVHPTPSTRPRTGSLSSISSASSKWAVPAPSTPHA